MSLTVRKYLLIVILVYGPFSIQAQNSGNPAPIAPIDPQLNILFLLVSLCFAAAVYWIQNRDTHLQKGTRSKAKEGSIN